MYNYAISHIKMSDGKIFNAINKNATDGKNGIGKNISTW